MKKFIKAIKRWRNRRLYHRLLWEYIGKYPSADTACCQAAIAFEWLTGEKWKDQF